MGKKKNNNHSSASGGRGRGLSNAPFIPGHGRGYFFRGRGRGYNPHTNAPGSSLTQEELDFTVQMYADAAKPPQEPVLGSSSGHSTTRGSRGRVRGWRGRGHNRDEYHTPPPNGNLNNHSHRGGYSSPIPRGAYTPRGSRGRGRNQGLLPPGEPDFSPRRGRGIGASVDSSPVANRKLGAGLTLSDLLYATRPLLKPIKFVRSEHTPFLFMYDQEEILKPVVEDTGDDEASHVPTADRIERIFHGGVGGEGSSSSSSSEDDNDDEDEEEIEEIDFNDLDKLVMSPPHKPTLTTSKKVKVDGVLQMVQDQVNTSSYQRSQLGTPQFQEAGPITAGNSKPVDEQSMTRQPIMDVSEPSHFSQQHKNNSVFCIDTQANFTPSTPLTPAQSRSARTPPLDDDEEIIVYVAPHPRVHSKPGPINKPTSGVMDNPAMDASGFEPYNPPAALSLASMSIQDSESTALVGQSVDDNPLPVSSSPPAHTPALFSAVASPKASSAAPAPVPLASTSTLASIPRLTPALVAQPPLVVAPHPTIASLKKFDFSQSSPLSSPDRKLPDIVPPRIAKKQKAWERKKARHERMKARKRGLHEGGREGGFAVYGALVDDARLYNDNEDQRWKERRRGDSDLDWGSEDDNHDGLRLRDEQLEPDLGNEGISSLSEKAKGKQKAQLDVAGDDHGMDVDSELDIEAMKQFVGGLMGKDAGTFTTMDDVEDERTLRKEDEEGMGGAVGSSDGDGDGDDMAIRDTHQGDESEEVEEVLELEERLLIGESSDDEGDGDGDDDDDELDVSPKSSFQARLERLRAKARANKPRDEDDDDDENDQDMIERHLAWAEEDEYDDTDDIINQIHDILDANSEILEGGNRKQRNKLFNAVQNGNFDIDFADMQQARKRRDKYKGVPPELLDQWELDRERKAERKYERDLQRLIAATDPFTKKKGGKKGRKAMLKAAATDPMTINLGPNRIIDITTLVQQIRRFIDDLDGPTTMSLPPANKETRKNIHELALAFGLKSLSKGKGHARYTTLTKTSKTGVGVDEWKVQKIVRRAGGRGARGDSFGGFEGEGVGGGRKGRGGVPRHKEGDQVGATAPKIGEGNLGFKMLAAMGWSEGNKIGLSGGLDAPLVAIIKHSKLGLGATK